MSKNYLFSLCLCVALAFQSCTKDDKDESPRELVTAGIYVLNEGFMESDNSSLSFHNLETGTTDIDFYKTVNGSKLGETAHDLKSYGSKLYCVITGTKGNKNSYLEVMNVYTGKTIKRIPFFDDKESYMPRGLVFYKNKAFVGGFDGKLSVVDTAKLTIESRFVAGGAMEGMAVMDAKLYIANSSHFMFKHPEYDNTVSVVDLTDQKLSAKIPVEFNPTALAASTGGKVFVAAQGEYKSESNLPALQVIDTRKNNFLSTFADTPIGGFAFSKSSALAIFDPFGVPSVNTLDPQSGKPGTPFISDGTQVQTPYGIVINDLNQDILVLDANSYAPAGEAFYFDKNGKFKLKFGTGTLPATAVFVYKTKQTEN